MRTLILTLALILPVPALAMDTSLDRPVSRSEAVAPANAKPADKRPGDAKPASDTTPVETATCVDGKVYYHQTGEHRGACAKHGGVASWTDGSPVKSRKGGRSSYR